MSSNAISGSFRFTETEPTPLVKDFETFIQYVEDTPFFLGKSREQIPYKHLVELNQRMSNPNTENNPRTPQHYYPQLHLYYHLALAGKLFQKVRPKSNAILEPNERLSLYRSLSPAEKYFFLLETLWVDCSWGDLGKGRFGAESYVTRFLEELSQVEPNKVIDFRGKANPVINDFFFVHYFLLFGWYDVVRDERKHRSSGTRYGFPIATLTPSPVGVSIAKILVQERPIEKWNIPYRRIMEGIITYTSLGSEASEKDYVPFFLPFQKICDGVLERTLPREKHKFVEGNFVFKVSVAPQIWRTIAISSEHDLDNLHYAIQEAFDFDCDHLYAFFMDDKSWSDEAFYSPYTDEGPYANEVRIGDLDLTINQPFLYLFDFGDEWHFEVLPIEIRKDEPLLTVPKIIEVHGDPPEQYPDYDEE